MNIKKIKFIFEVVQLLETYSEHSQTSIMGWGFFVIIVTGNFSTVFDFVVINLSLAAVKIEFCTIPKLREFR